MMRRALIASFLTISAVASAGLSYAQQQGSQQQGQPQNSQQQVSPQAILQQYKAAMPDAQFKQTLDAADAYRDYLLGFCLNRVRGRGLEKSTVNYGAWEKIDDAATTRELNLFAPRVSPDTFSIVDVSNTRQSCWTQHDTIAAGLSMYPIMQVFNKIPSEAVSIVDFEEGEGFEETTVLYNPNDGLKPVLIYFYVTYAPQEERIVGIVRDATTEQNNGG